MANVKLGNKIYENVETVKLDTADGGTVEFADRDAAVEAGKQEAYDKFWDMFQENGNRPHYFYAFAFFGWDDIFYNPKYPITPTNANGISAMFQQNTKITDTKVPITAFGNCNVAFASTNIKRIPKIIFSGTTSATNLFYGCSQLEEVYCEGEIPVDISLAQSSKLTNASVQSIIDCLKDLTGQTAKTVTFHGTVGANMTEEQKAAITAKNWTLVY